jgi:ADP-L-glycero-D-manno-heptose 6-epimerase
MIVITGAAGFIGWNIYQSLKHIRDIVLVDFTDKFADEFSPKHPVMNPFTFLEKLKNDSYAKQIEIIIHQGACSDTTVYDPSFMMKHNFDYSAAILQVCLKHNIRLIYASSASVYGDGPFHEEAYLNPKNVYANSKRVFDDYAESFAVHKNSPQIVGLRYFNVYGPMEYRKGPMASVIQQFKKQIDSTGEIKIFKGSNMFLRDFIYVDDIVSINKHFIENRKISGIFNCGTGIAEAFSAIPEIMSEYYSFKTTQIDMPENLIGKYQKFTRADTDKLYEIGKYDKPFSSLHGGIDKYVQHWKKH